MVGEIPYCMVFWSMNGDYQKINKQIMIRTVLPEDAEGVLSI